MTTSVPRTWLPDVYWIGAGSGAGKSTIAQRIAAQHGLYVYATDDVMSDHAGRSIAEDAPYLSRFKAMDRDGWSLVGVLDLGWWVLVHGLGWRSWVGCFETLGGRGRV